MKQLIVANWKMNGSKELLNDCFAAWQLINTENDIVVCPPFPLISNAKSLVIKANFHIGAQDCHASGQGAFTGSVNASILKEVGCTYVIVGHSERRQQFDETNELINTKANQVIKLGMIPIVCAGETLADYESNNTAAVVEEQLKLSCPSQGSFVVAYEPVWAIGTGKTATLDEIEKVHGLIRSIVGENTPVLYGGSVTADNAHDILRAKNVNGVLVGGASLKPNDFAEIIKVSV
jgi:triosephosphate isomerase